MLKSLRYLVLALFVVSCGASVNPALQQKVNNYYSKPSGSSKFTMSGKFLQPMPLAVGQWVMFGSTNDGKRTIQKTSIIGKEGGAWIIDTYQLDETKETATQMCVEGFDKVSKDGNMDAIDIKWIKMKDEEGKITTIEGPALSFMKGFYKKGLSLGFSADVSSSLDAGTATVPAGTFNNAAKIKSEVSFLGSTYRSESWYHSDVPISGLVKSVSEDNKSIMELLDFGTTGATPSF